MNLPTLQFESWASLWEAYGTRMVSAAVKIVVIIIAYLVIRFVMIKIINRVVESMFARVGGEILRARQSRILALQSVVTSVVGFVLGFIAVIMVLQTVGFNVVPLLTTASVAGLAIGFGAQKLVKDVINGFFILAEDQYGVGDYVTIGAVTGVVEEVGMRTTRIRDGAGKLCIIANGDIIQVCNHSRGVLFVSFEINLAADSDMDRAAALIDQTGEKLTADMPSKVAEAFKYGGVSQITGSCTTVKVQGAVSAQYQEQVLMEMRERLRRRFAEEELKLA